MPPKVKFQREEIVEAAMNVACKKGIDAVTAREVAKELHVSVGPIFTWFESMEQLCAAVHDQAKDNYLDCLRQGLDSQIPFLGVWRQHLRFAREDPELYRLLFLTRPDSVSGGALEVLKYSQDLARPSIMRIYNMDAQMADSFFRDIWLVAFSFTTLIATDDCPYTDDEILAVGTEISLSVCKAYKEIPGLSTGDFDRDAIFRELVKR